MQVPSVKRSWRFLPATCKLVHKINKRAELIIAKWKLTRFDCSLIEAG